MLTHIAICGGGVSGIKFCGSLKYLERQAYLTDVTCFLGTSIGSIIAMFLTYTSIDQVIENLKSFKSFNSNDIDLKLLFTEFGIFSKKEFILSLEKIIYQDFDSVPSLLELYNHSKKELIISAYNLDKNNLEYFSYKSHPHVLVTKAISLSINLLFMFEKEVFENNTYIDPGPINNISWEYFDNVSKSNKLGIYLAANRLATGSNDTFINYSINVLKSIYDQVGVLYEKNIDLGSENIFVLTDDISFQHILSEPTDCDIECMLKSGYDSMQTYLKKTI